MSRPHSSRDASRTFMPGVSSYITSRRVFVYTASEAYPTMRVGVPPRLAPAPKVNYPDYDDFSKRCAELHNTYSRLVQSAVARRKAQSQTFVRPSNSAYPFFTPRDLLLVGLAEFADLRRPGLAGAAVSCVACAYAAACTARRALSVPRLLPIHTSHSPAISSDMTVATDAQRSSSFPVAGV